MNVKYNIIRVLYRSEGLSTLLFQSNCDVIAYSARQMYEPNKYMKKKGGHNFYKRLMPVLNTAASTNNPLGIVEQ